jgi:hypothetical protein
MKPLTSFEKDWIRRNFVELAIEHRRRCRRKDCPIQLLSLAVALKHLRIKVSDKEMEAFG